VLPRKGGGFNGDAAAVQHDLFDHDHGVAALGHGVAGIDGKAGFPGLER